MGDSTILLHRPAKQTSTQTIGLTPHQNSLSKGHFISKCATETNQSLLAADRREKQLAEFSTDDATLHLKVSHDAF
eukprot:6214813-Pleurochrysis_carterae.AAC.6